MKTGNSALFLEDFEMSNCFTFSPMVGFTFGIEVLSNVRRSNNDGVLRPHVSVGQHFCQLDYLQPPKCENGFLLSARVKDIGEGGKIHVLSAQQDSKAIIVLVDINVVPSHGHRHVDPTAVQAWVDFQTDAYITQKHNISGRCLVEFTKDEQEMLIFDRDGAVYRIVRRNSAMVVDVLTPLEMAKERVALIREQLQRHSEGFHGIIGGAIRLLKTSARNAKIRELFVDFLADFADGRLNDYERKDIHHLLRAFGDPRAAMFAEGYDSNVVLFQKPKASKPKSNKAERRARDQAVRAEMRGASNGGQPRSKKSS